jgi:hypothetical protein
MSNLSVQSLLFLDKLSMSSFSNIIPDFAPQIQPPQLLFQAKHYLSQPIKKCKEMQLNHKGILMALFQFLFERFVLL